MPEASHPFRLSLPLRRLFGRIGSGQDLDPGAPFHKDEEDDALEDVQRSLDPVEGHDRDGRAVGDDHRRHDADAPDKAGIEQERCDGLPAEADDVIASVVVGVEDRVERFSPDEPSGDLMHFRRKVRIQSRLKVSPSTLGTYLTDELFSCQSAWKKSL